MYSSFLTRDHPRPPWRGSWLSLPLLLSLLAAPLSLASCIEEEEWVDPTGDDDDDASDDDDSDPWGDLAGPGVYEGSSLGTVSFTGAGQYSCEGSIQLEVDEDRVATGTIECEFPNSATLCSLDIDQVTLDSGTEEFELECYGPGSGLLQIWSTNATWLGGRWYRSNEAAGVEITWNAERVEDPE